MVALSLIIPTYNENRNLPLLVNRILAALDTVEQSFDIWFIDDSTDDTPVILHALQMRFPMIHAIHRTQKRGLGSALLEGFEQSQGKWIIAMDADLQHPPELLPAILTCLRQGADIVIPSRFMQGGSDGGLNFFRKTVSWTARTLSRCLIRRLRSYSDCTSGYFGLKRKVINETDLAPGSWKILMEILVKGHYNTVSEVPYSFASRDAGESKMGWREQWQFLKHLFTLAKQQRTHSVPE